MRWSSLILVLFLVGCGTDRILPSKLDIRVVQPPAELFQCPGMPVIEDREYSDNDVALLMAQMYAAGTQCRTQLEAVRAYLEDAKRISEQDNPESEGEGRGFLGLDWF